MHVIKYSKGYVCGTIDVSQEAESQGPSTGSSTKMNGEFVMES